jgi:hypothetical protein
MFVQILKLSIYHPKITLHNLPKPLKTCTNKPKPTKTYTNLLKQEITVSPHRMFVLSIAVRIKHHYSIRTVCGKHQKSINTVSEQYAKSMKGVW